MKKVISTSTEVSNLISVLMCMRPVDRMRWADKVLPVRDWRAYTVSARTLKNWANGFFSGCGKDKFFRAIIPPKSKLVQFRGKTVFIYIAEKLDGGTSVRIYVKAI